MHSVQTRKVMSTDKFREITAFSPYFWICRRVTSLPLFSEYLLSQLSLLKVSLLNKLQHVYFMHSALWTDPIRMFEKCPYFPDIGAARRIIERIFRIIVYILIPE